MKFLNNIEVGSSPNFTLPLSDGSANQILQTNGSGTVTWVDLPAGTTDTNDYVTAAAFNTSTGVVTLTVQNQTAVTVNLDGRYLTAHPNITAASSVNNSGSDFIQDITLDSNGHVTGLVTATAPVGINGTSIWFAGADSHTGTGTGTTMVGSTSSVPELLFEGANGISTETNSNNGTLTIDGSGVVGSYTWTVHDDTGSVAVTNGTHIQWGGTVSGSGTSGSPYVFPANHPTISAASSVNNSGSTYIQDVTLDSNGHVTGITSAAVTYPFSEFNVADGYGTTSAVNDGNTVTFSGSGGIYVSNDGANTFDIQLKHLGLQNLTDPNADRIAFWDDSSNAFAWLTAGSNLTISGTTINATNTNTTYTAGAGLDLTGTVFSLESDLRGDVQYVGNSANDYIEFDAASGTRMDFYVNGAITGAFRNDGSPELHCDGDIIAYSATISDARLKEDVETIENASEKVSQLRGVEYTWKKGSRKGQREMGLIAQEVEEVVPSIVREKKLVLVDGLDDSSASYKTVDYEKLIALLIESNKEQQDIIAQLEERVIDLENRL
jgi:hypothetical protein